MNSLLILGLFLTATDPIPVGKSVIEARFDDVPIKLFAYKPPNWTDGPLVMVFHGVLRNAEEYRDDSIEMGDRFRALIIAPHFDDVQFPLWKYQFGGIVRDGQATPEDQWTGEYVNRITRLIRDREGRPEMPLYLIGHSGGGQFLIRLAAFIKTDARRIVVANAGTHLFPTFSAEFPFGFGGLPAELQTEERLRHYLAQPLTFYLGTDDTERDEYLDVSPAAETQGKFRFERGNNAFLAGKKLAAERRWKFGWKLTIATGIEHDHTKMFNHPQCAKALELAEFK